jgi:hypothetical protein
MHPLRLLREINDSPVRDENIAIPLSTNNYAALSGRNTETHQQPPGVARGYVNQAFQAEYEYKQPDAETANPRLC